MTELLIMELFLNNEGYQLIQYSIFAKLSFFSGMNYLGFSNFFCLFLHYFLVHEILLLINELFSHNEYGKILYDFMKIKK